jgi:hypothetical protein|eukprot:COSAG06_NODE_3615_length_5117_cov_21.630331_2_plen_440_part_00
MRQRLLDPEPAVGGLGGAPASVHAYTHDRMSRLHAVTTSEPSSSRSSSPGAGVPEGQPVFASRLARGLTSFTSQFQHDLPTLPTYGEDDGGLQGWAPPAIPASATPAAASTAASDERAGGDRPASPSASTDSGAHSDAGELGANDETGVPVMDMSTASAVAAATVALAGMSSTIESCLLVLTVIALGGVLFILGNVLVPLILAVFIASMIMPFIDLLTDRPLRLCGKYWCQRYWCDPALDLEQRWPNVFCRAITSILTIRFPNVLAMLTTLAMLGFFLLVAGWLLLTSLQAFVGRAGAYEDELQHWADLGAQTMSQDVNMTVVKFIQQTSGSVVGVDVSDATSVYTYLSQGGIQSTFVQILEAIGGTLASGALIVMYVIFILLGRQARGERKGKAVTYAVEHQLKIYISWKTGISAATGMAVGSTLYILDCDLGECDAD